mmetsp:Transcript_976/g.2038  ORF Transcript_976/g.2038 Transcript_976/m.2038 type:complete len:553 (-) Transcript_976:1887-3545(-)
MTHSMRSLQTLLRGTSQHYQRDAVRIQPFSRFKLHCGQRYRCQYTHSLHAAVLPANIRSRGCIHEAVVGWANNNFCARNTSTVAARNIDWSNRNDTIIDSKSGDSKSGDMMDTYAVAVITSTTDGNTKLEKKNLSIQQIVKEIPGTHARDFFSLSLTSLGDASRKRRAMMNHHYSVKNSIHPWFILPRESEIVMGFGCVRAVINKKSALIFDAHKPTIKQQAMRISKQLTRKDNFAFRDGEIIFHSGGKNKSTQFEIDMVEQIIQEVCTMYSRRISLYEPIVNSLMDRVTNEAFSPSGLHKLVPVKDSLQHFEMNVKGALHCITDLLSNDEDMLDLLLTEKAIAKSENRTLPIESHESVEMLLEEYARQLNSTLLEIDYMLQRVQSKQDMVALSLDAYRNRMIRMNLYLTVGGISLAFGTAVAGFFGMNVVNGWEEAEGVFELVVVGSCFFGGGFLSFCYSYLNGSRAQRRTLDHLNTIEVMNRALGDMSALDHSFELMLDEKEPLTREKFREKIYASEPVCIRDTEVDFLFDLLDYSNNDVIDKDDFHHKG